MKTIFLKNNITHNNMSRKKEEQLTIIGDIVGVEYGRYDVDRNWEDYSAVVICGDTAQGLEVAHLKNKISLKFDINIFNLDFFFKLSRRKNKEKEQQKIIP
jgi:hypothetical protein